MSQDPKLITCFPERMELVAGGTCLQLRNRYGTAVYSIADEKLSWVSTADEIPVDYRNLGGNLGTAKNSYEWSYWVVYSVA